VYRTQVDVVLRNGCTVLNASDEIVASLAELSDGEVIFFAADPACPALAEHIAAGKRGIFVRDGRITLATGGEEIRLCRLGDVPLIGRQKDPSTIANVLAAVAAGWALGLTKEVIGTGVKTFGLELPDPAALLPQSARRSPPVAFRN
ncbi:MAG: cyanophycin synthetase, partial [Candidatus Dechloromonas phosphoritropha]